VLAIAIDKAALYGTAAGGQPQGLDDLATAVAADFAAATPTHGELVGMEGTVDTGNALMGNLAYLVHPSLKAALKVAKVDAGSGIFVWDAAGNTVNGYNAVASAQVTAGDVFFGNWADLLIGMWGGLDITVDPYSLSTSGGIRVVALQSVDVAVRHGASFVFGNDGA
jgi:hypothetical protein